MIPLCDLHIHTTFCDGKNTPEEMVLEAIRRGCHTIGFSGHAPTSVLWDPDWCIDERKLTDYCLEIQRLKKKYTEQIEILLGLELDYFSPKPSFACDYLIGSVHYTKPPQDYVSVDSGYDMLKAPLDDYYDGDILALARDFYTNTAQIVKRTNCTIVGHFDLLTKYNEKYSYLNEEDPRYRKLAIDALDCVLENDVFIEINTGAMARGQRSLPYPAPFLLKRIAEKNGKVILSSDAHQTAHLLYAFKDAVEYAGASGIRELWIYRDHKFDSIPIGTF